MKAISNWAGVTLGLFLMGVLMVAQQGYQKSFGGEAASNVAGYQAVVSK